MEGSVNVTDQAVPVSFLSVSQHYCCNGISLTLTAHSKRPTTFELCNCHTHTHTLTRMHARAHTHSSYAHPLHQETNHFVQCLSHRCSFDPTVKL